MVSDKANLKPGAYEIKFKYVKIIDKRYIIDEKEHSKYDSDELRKEVPAKFTCPDNIKEVFLPEGYKKPGKVTFKIVESR